MSERELSVCFTAPTCDDVTSTMTQLSMEDDGAVARPVSRKRNKPDYRRTKSLYGATPNVKFGPKASVMTAQQQVLTIADPGSQRLNWYKPPLSVLIIKKIHDEAIVSPFIDCVDWLSTAKNMVVYIECKVLNERPVLEHHHYKRLVKQVTTFTEGVDDLNNKIDLIITMGGDGTLLYASNLFQESVPPVVAFHFGSLGFLSPHDFTDYRGKLTQVLSGNVPLCLRTRLKCSICRLGTACARMSEYSIKNVESRQHILVLNEIVVDRGPSSYIVNLDLYIDHKLITSVQGDGLLISTPTGSTAYAAAAGASMVHPNVPAIVIAPICAHSLSFRPIVVPAGVEIKIQVNEDARDSAWMSFDGRNRSPLEKGDILRVSTSIYPVPSICAADQMTDWFESLSDCLHWNVRRPQKPLGASVSNDSLLSNGNANASVESPNTSRSNAVADGSKS